MVDGRQNYETKEVTNFTGLNASVNATKEAFLDSDSPYSLNFISPNGILEARNGRARINSTRYDNEITSITSYKDRSDVIHTVFTVKNTVAEPTDPDGTIQETH